MRLIFIGGMRYLPIDEEQSRELGYQVRILEDGFTEKNADYFRIDFLIKFTRNREKFSGEWSLDLMNLTNSRNELYYLLGKQRKCTTYGVPESAYTGHKLPDSVLRKQNYETEIMNYMLLLTALFLVHLSRL